MFKPWYITYFNRDEEANRQKNCFPEPEDKEINEIEKTLALKPGMNVLDLACGVGRYAIAFASKGYRVTGVDISEPCITLARKNAHKQGLKIQFEIRDMRNLEHKGIFDAIFCINTSFGLLESDVEHLRALVVVRRALKKEGKFLLQMLNRDSLLKRLSVVEGKIEGYIGKDCYFNRISGILVSKQLLYGNSSFIITTLRLFTVSEIETLMQKAGMIVTGIYGGYDQENLTFTSGGMVIVAKPNLA